ncbi:hypothetical protein E2C01_075279 [Portunus trituberculatus]|uniref:Uncharacterized protein n=1 Tax=Portunus trituberculatus TaxID=210409 RepID=A0A5B7IAC3_PORTR|nr:hypothetical protein [Portunus trituberculatus]
MMTGHKKLRGHRRLSVLQEEKLVWVRTSRDDMTQWDLPSPTPPVTKNNHENNTTSISNNNTNINSDIHNNHQRQ